MKLNVRSQESVVDGTLLSWLTNLGSAHGAIVSLLNRLPIGDPLAVAWRVYVTANRAWIFERRSGDDGFTGGMSVMLCIPRHPASTIEVQIGDAAWLDKVDVFGVPLLVGDVASPTIYCLNSGTLPSSAESWLRRPDSLMSQPCWVPAWSVYPSRGYSHGWKALEAKTDSKTGTLWQWIAKLSSPHLARFKAALLPYLDQSPQINVSVVGDFLSALSALEELLAQSMVGRFVEHLNPVVVGECLSKRMGIYPEEYNWVVSGKHARAWAWRMDALTVFPAISVSAVIPSLAPANPIAEDIIRKFPKSNLRAEVAPVDGVKKYAEVVDGGRPLIKGLASSLGVRTVALRALKGVTNRTVEMFGQPPLGWEDILRTLDRIAPERHPESPDEWKSFSVLYLECIHLYRTISLLHTGLARKFMDTTARVWLAQRAKNWKRSELAWCDGMRGLADLSVSSALADEVSAITKALGLNASERYKSYAKFAKLNPCSWRALVHKLGRLEEPITPWNEYWTDRLMHGLRVRSLNSAELLLEESQVMRHCIHTYRDQLDREPQLAFAIGKDRTSDRSTLLLVYHKDQTQNWRVSLLGHKARFNRLPSTACQIAALKLCKELSSESCIDLLNHANFERIRRRGSPYRGEVRLARTVQACHRQLDRTAVREPLLMLIAGS